MNTDDILPLEGVSEYTTCANLLTTSSATWPQSALFQIAAAGVPLSKLVIGKPATSSDANNGYIAPATLASCLQQAKAQGWCTIYFLNRLVMLLTSIGLQLEVPWRGR